MAGITIPHRQDKTKTDGIRPVNLQTDLAGLADLIETAFSSSMDSGGRSAIREMRQLSRLGLGLRLLAGLNDLAQGMSLGYVWVIDNRIIGNVSVYPADYPADMGKVWIIANVAVYPEYRGRGIATQLMYASLDMIQNRAGGTAILQVDYDNEVAQHMYRKLGFVAERPFAQWHRARYLPQRTHNGFQEPQPAAVRIVGRKLGDSSRELALAKMVRPQQAGGLDWMRPTHINTFRRTPLKRLGNWLNLRTIQRLVVRDNDNLRAWLQIEASAGTISRQLTLMTVPDDREKLANALIATAIRRFGGDGLLMNHPADDDAVNQVLRANQFSIRRTVLHMRYNF